MPSHIEVATSPIDERTALINVLDAQRIGLIRKVEDVDDVAARRTPTASSLCLLALLKHATTWEERWFAVIMAGRSADDEWPEVLPDPLDADLVVDENDAVEEWLARYRARIEESNEIAVSMKLDAACARPDLIECNLRYTLLHMIAETARHAGHADIVRESLDGSTGI